MFFVVVVVVVVWDFVIFLMRREETTLPVSGNKSIKIVIMKRLRNKVMSPV